MTFQATSIMILDTETTSLHRDVYDVAFVVSDRKGRIKQQYHAMVREVATDPDKMSKGFYAKKTYTHYFPMLDEQVIRLQNWIEIVGVIRDAVLTHNVQVVSAYNLPFDMKVLKATNQDFGNGHIMPRPVRTLDLWRFSVMSVLSQKTYERVALDQGWYKQETGNIFTNAECSYRYISGDWSFKEQHTALNDALIENEIMARCFASKKRVPFDDVLENKTSPWKLLPYNAANMAARRK